MNKIAIARLLLFLSAATFVADSSSHASVRAPARAEDRLSAQRTAQRALERQTSTQWMPDVADRIRILLELSEHVAPEVSPLTPRNATEPYPWSRSRSDATTARPTESDR
jgi:hypothetical protein